jgi:RNA polymerase sigma factor (sigma-70 family)
MENQSQEFYVTINGQQVPVSEEVYRAYKRPAWAEHKRQERSKRCIGENGSRCNGDCSKCDKLRTGGTLSLNAFEEDGFEPSDTSPDPAEIVADKLLLEELFKALDELDPDSRRICKLIAQGATEREIAAMLGIRQSTLNYRKRQLMVRLRDRLSDFI